MLRFPWSCDVGGGNKEEKILNVLGPKFTPYKPRCSGVGQFIYYSKTNYPCELGFALNSSLFLSLVPHSSGSRGTLK